MAKRRLSDEISKRILSSLWNYGDVMLPNYFYTRHEMDVFRLTKSGFVIEYEIKVSRSDFFADFKKLNKHANLEKGKTSDWTKLPNRFFFVVPENLVSVEECPKHVGLIYYTKWGFDLKKNAPLIHKGKFERYTQLLNTMSFREFELRKKLNRLTK